MALKKDTYDPSVQINVRVPMYLKLMIDAYRLNQSEIIRSAFESELQARIEMGHLPTDPNAFRKAMEILKSNPNIAGKYPHIFTPEYDNKLKEQVKKIEGEKAEIEAKVQEGLKKIEEDKGKKATKHDIERRSKWLMGEISKFMTKDDLKTFVQKYQEAMSSQDKPLEERDKLQSNLAMEIYNKLKSSIDPKIWADNAVDEYLLDKTVNSRTIEVTILKAAKDVGLS